MAGDATALEDGADVLEELDVDDAGRFDADARLALGVLGEQGRAADEVFGLVAGGARGGLGDIERLLRMRMAAAAIGANFAGPDLVPSHGRVEREAVAVEGLKSEGGVGGDLGEEAGVGIAVGVDRLSGKSVLCVHKTILVSL